MATSRITIVALLDLITCYKLAKFQLSPQRGLWVIKFLKHACQSVLKESKFEKFSKFYA